MKLDPNEAPEGYVAVPIGNNPANFCRGCAFQNDEEMCNSAKCMIVNRKDRQSVIFKKREKAPESKPSRADEYALFQELLRIAGSLNRSNNIIANIQRLEEIATVLDHTDYATPRESFAGWVADQLANPLATTGETD